MNRSTERESIGIAIHEGRERASYIVGIGGNTAVFPVLLGSLQKNRLSGYTLLEYTHEEKPGGVEGQ